MKRLLTISPLLALALSLGGCGEPAVTADTPKKAVECVWKSPDTMPQSVKDAITKTSWNFDLISSAQARPGGGSYGGSRGYSSGYRPSPTPSYRPSYSPRPTYNPRPNITPRPTTTSPSNRVNTRPSTGAPMRSSYRRTTDPAIINARRSAYTPSAAPVTVNNGGSWFWPTMAVLYFMHSSNSATAGTALANQSDCLAYKYEGAIKLTPNGETLTK